MTVEMQVGALGGPATIASQLYGEINRRNHAVRTRDSFAGNFKRCAVIGTGTGKRKAKGHIHTLVKGVKFQWDQTLIVIHAEHRIEFTFNCTVKNCVGGNRANDSRFSILDFRLQLRYRRADDLDSLHGQVCRIPRHADSIRQRRCAASLRSVN